MNKPSPIGRFRNAPSVPSAPASGYSPVTEVGVSFSRIARVSGEAFDADQIGWSCDECGRDEYSCECELVTGYPRLTSFPGGASLTMDQVNERIARFFDLDGTILSPTINKGRLEL